jgi:DNA repair ATPase RecN
VVSRTEVLAEEREKLSTAAGLEVLTPTFITLMHELGHALKIVSGGYLPDDNLLMAHFVNELPQLQRKWWEAVQGRPNMLEELINVLGVENPVRQESGLAPREIYQSTRDVIVVNTRDKLREVLKRDADSSRYLPDLVKAYTDLQNPNITLQRVEEIKRNLDRITPEVQKQMKANRALYLRDRLEQFIQQQKPRDQERIQRTKRYDRLYGRLSGIANNPTLDAQNAPLEELEKELENFKEDRQTLIEAGKLIKSFQKGGLRSRLAKAVHEGGDIQDYLPWRTK